MYNNNIHYDYCKCCGALVRKTALWDGDQICRECHRTYGYDWPHKKPENQED